MRSARLRTPLPYRPRFGQITRPFFDCTRCISLLCSEKALRMSSLDSYRGMFGSMPLPGFYTPMIDEKIPSEDRAEKFCHWVSGYFQHGDIRTRNPDVLSWVEPSTIRPANIHNMTTDEKKEILCFSQGPKYDEPLHNRFSRTICRRVSQSILR